MMIESEKKKVAPKVKKTNISKAKIIKKPKTAEVNLPAKVKKSTCLAWEEQTPIAVKNETGRQQEQLEKYSTLPYHKTYRGIAFYMTLFVAMITTLSTFIGEQFNLLYGLSFIIPLLYLISRSYRWVYAVAIIWWSSEKALQVMESSSPSMALSAILWWFVISYLYYRAFKVESLRVKEVREEGVSLQRRNYIKDIAIGVSLFFFVTFFVAFFSV